MMTKGVLWLLILGALSYGVPQIKTYSPSHNALIFGSRFIVSGVIKDASRVTVNGRSIYLGTGGAFKTEITCVPGPMTVFIRATQTHEFDSLSYRVNCLQTYDDIKTGRSHREMALMLTYLGGWPLYTGPHLNPSSYVNRAELMWILTTLKGLAPLYSLRPKYRDVMPSHWAYPYIERASREFHLPSGNRGSFSPDGYVTREEFRDYMSRFLRKKRLKVKELSPGRLINREEVLVGLYQTQYVQRKIAKMLDKKSSRLIASSSHPKSTRIGEISIVKHDPIGLSLAWIPNWNYPKVSVPKIPLHKIKELRDRYFRSKDKHYVVQKGDTLPRISRQLTGSSNNWEAIAHYNQITVTERRSKSGRKYKSVKIFAGKTLRIPGRLIN